MSHTFKILIERDLSTVLMEVQSTIVKNGGDFKGNTSKGNFAGKTILGKVKGKYASLSEDEVEITITKKPFAAPKSKIESAIREYFT